MVVVATWGSGGGAGGPGDGVRGGLVGRCGGTFGFGRISCGGGGRGGPGLLEKAVTDVERDWLDLRCFKLRGMELTLGGGLNRRALEWTSATKGSRSQLSRCSSPTWVITFSYKIDHQVFLKLSKNFQEYWKWKKEGL